MTATRPEILTLHPTSLPARKTKLEKKERSTQDLLVDGGLALYVRLRCRVARALPGDPGQVRVHAEGAAGLVEHRVSDLKRRGLKKMRSGAFAVTASGTAF